MNKTKVVSIGEALIDRIKNKSDEEFTDFLGGAPANVSCALRKLQIDSTFIGCLGKDKYGDEFIEYFNELGVNINFLQVDNYLPTRIVSIKRDNFGDRYFSGFDYGSHKAFADEALNRKLFEKDIKSLEKLFSETKYLVTGTIILSSSISAESLYFLLSIAKQFDVRIIIDLNWRKVFWDSSTFSFATNKKERIDLIKKFLDFANILKLAKEEALLFFESANPFEISQQISNKPDVIITDGGNPISWIINGIQGTTEIINTYKIVDTTGAGDAFLAGLISQLVSIDYSLDELAIKNIVKFASICGLLTCLDEGAIKPQPTYDKVKKFLGSQIL